MALTRRGKVGLGVLAGAAIIAFVLPFFFGPIRVGGLSDRSAPTTTLEIRGQEGEAGWWRSAVLVTLRAHDDVALGKIHYELDGAEKIVATPQEQDSSTAFAVDTDGRHSVTYWSEDRSGNLEGRKTLALKIDTVAPAISFGLKDEYIQLETVTISFSVSDTQSPVSASAKLDDGNAVGDGETIKADVLKNGRHDVKVVASDEAGNVAEATKDFRIKKLAETIQDYGDNGQINNGGIVNSLLVKADHAFDKIDSGQADVGVHKLNALENHIRAQMGKHIDTTAAEDLLSLTRAIMEAASNTP